MHRLNYQHLFYFWTAAREGGITRASEKLGLAQPTISGQITVFEETIGSQLLKKDGRKLILTETGRTVFNYAEEIFSLGNELSNTLKGASNNRSLRLTIGIADSLPKLLVYRLIEPALKLDRPVQITCYEDKKEHLLVELSHHGIDLIFSDGPAANNLGARVHNHFIGVSNIGVFSSPNLAQRYRDDFPWSLKSAPLILPTRNTELRRSLDQWFEDKVIAPRVVAEIADSALMKTFASSGAGIIFAPVSVRNQIRNQYDLDLIGETSEINERFYAITIRRKIEHEAVKIILENAKNCLK
jgi:LysR family transcriptional activator of nhaA